MKTFANCRFGSHSCSLAAALLAGAALCGAAGADIVQVQIHGVVEYNQIRGGQLDRAIIKSGAVTTVSFLLDSTQFMNDPDGLPTRGYFVNAASFQATFNGVVIGMENPYQNGQPMFVLRDNDPAVDGFFLSNGTAYDAPVNMTEQGLAGPLGRHFKVTYTGDTLSSLNITDAVGHYDYDGLMAFYDTVDDGGQDPMGIEFMSMDITIVPTPGALPLIAAAGLVGIRRRR